VDIAYAPFIERFQPFLKDVKNYDITIGRPKLAAWIEVENTVKSYLFIYVCLLIMVIEKIFHNMGNLPVIALMQLYG
jgi:hypothetical protein